MITGTVEHQDVGAQVIHVKAAELTAAYLDQPAPGQGVPFQQHGEEVLRAWFGDGDQLLARR